MNASEVLDSVHICTCSDEKIMAKEITLKPIGIVRSENLKHKYGGWQDHVSEVIIRSDLLGALKDLEHYSHVMIVFWMDQVCDIKMTHTPQGKKEEIPEVGILACRCPARPNPIACTTVKLLKVEGNVLTVEGLDAIHDSPVIDVKPIHPAYDTVHPDEVRVPDWVHKLDF
jgi:tRNA-Thr(GGU) m(6)t(6)A37 methyltransferase TsaA